VRITKINLGKGLNRTWRVFTRVLGRAERLVEKKPVAALATAVKAYEKATRVGGALQRLLNDIQGFVRLVRAWVRGEYRTVSKRTIILVVGALLYLLCPIDAILDAIPFAGFIDDAAVLGWVLAQVRSEIEAFAAWEATGPQPRALPALPALPAESAAA
jgi:uncharacterized membrane protein YkvA (DUF1232 family)